MQEALAAISWGFSLVALSLALCGCVTAIAMPGGSAVAISVCDAGLTPRDQ
jgi:hypothetical protein